MSLRLFIDEDYQAKRLVKVLEKAGHDVLTVNDVQMAGAPDDEIFQFANKDDRIILTRNGKDFRELHKQYPEHPGIFAVYEDNASHKNMGHIAVVEAIRNIETASLDIRYQFIELNRWQY